MLFIHGKTDSPPGKTGRLLKKLFPEIAIPLFPNDFHGKPFYRQVETIRSLWQANEGIVIGNSYGAYLCLNALLDSLKADEEYPRTLILTAAHFGLLIRGGCGVRAPRANRLRSALGLGGPPQFNIPKRLQLVFIHGVEDDYCSLKEVEQVCSHFPGIMELIPVPGGHRLSPEGRKILVDLFRETEGKVSGVRL